MTNKPVKKKQVTKKEVKFEEVQEKKSGQIAIERGNIDMVTIQFLQAINNQLGMIIKLLEAKK